MPLPTPLKRSASTVACLIMLHQKNSKSGRRSASSTMQTQILLPAQCHICGSSIWQPPHKVYGRYPPGLAGPSTFRSAPQGDTYSCKWMRSAANLIILRSANTTDQHHSGSTTSSSGASKANQCQTGSIQLFGLVHGPPLASRDAHLHQKTSPNVGVTNAGSLPPYSGSPTVPPRACNPSVEALAPGWTSLIGAVTKVACSVLSSLTAP